MNYCSKSKFIFIFAEIIGKMDDKISSSETRQCRVILPGLLNDHGILFGGTAMQWMDEVAYITATRYSKMRMVTVSVENVNFILPVYQGMIAEVIGTIKKAGSVKLKVQIELYVEDMYNNNRQKAMDAMFTFAAVDDNHKPVLLNYRKNEP
jgi:acyl-CoA hydrolase